MAVWYYSNEPVRFGAGAVALFDVLQQAAIGHVWSGDSYNSIMRIFIACPAPAGSRKGNRITAVRWAQLLRSLDYRVVIAQQYDGRPADLLIGLHARRSYESVRLFRKQQPRTPIVVALTGTDVYRDIHRSRQAQKSLDMADRLVVLQPLATAELPSILRNRARTIYQSVQPIRISPPFWPPRHFRVIVLGHLRPVKDPFRAALALRYLSPESRIRVVQVGQALDPGMAKRAQYLTRHDPRYQWIGEVPRWKARRILARSTLLVLSSRMEGGANVISESVVSDVPVLASRIAGSVGLLGEDYPGYFPVEDTRALAELLIKAETSQDFYAKLKECCRLIAPLFDPECERQSWRKLLAELS
jgi:putative glycosyltransferase (TIGR04348 family)